MTDRMVTTAEYMALLQERAEWQARADRAEAKLAAITAFVDKANEEFTKAAAEDAAMVERFNG